MTSSTLEFRVLSGLQVGARIRLPDGVYTVGCGLECDIVIHGQSIQEQHFTLVVEGDSVTLKPQKGSVGTANGQVSGEEALTIGQPFTASSIWLQVAWIDAPWPDDDELVVGPRKSEQSPAPSTESAAEPTVAKPESSTESSSRSEKADTGKAEKGTEKQQAAGRKGVLVLLIGMVVTVLSGAIALAIVSPEAQNAGTDALARKKAVSSDADAMSCAAQILRNLNLQSRTRVALAPNNQPIVSGYTSSDADLSTLTTKLAKTCPQADVQVRSDETLATQAKSLLKRHSQAWTFHSIKDGRLTLSYSGEGEVLLSTLQDELLRNVNGLVAVEQAAPEASTLQQEMQAMLEKQGIATSFAMTVNNDRLQVTGSPSKTELGQWEELLAKLQKKYGSQLPVVAKFEQRRNALPFRIHQVVSGPMPFVVVDDGSRLYEGGMYQSYRLISVKDRQLVFGGPETVEISW